MDDQRDPQLDTTLTETYRAHGRRLGHVAPGDVDGVYRRARQRQSRRRAAAAVGSTAIVAVGIAGLIGLTRTGPDALSSGGPATTAAVGDAGSWYVCSRATELDGAPVYEWCELESAYSAPAWRCSDELPADDGDDRPRFERCTAVGDLPTFDACQPAGTAPPTAPPVDARPTTPPSAPPVTMAGPPATWVDSLCGATAPSTVPAMLPGSAPTAAPLAPPAPTNPPGTAPPATTADEVTYSISAGDNPTSVAVRFGVTLDELIAYNDWDLDRLTFLVGETVRIPPRSGSYEPPPVIGIGDAVMLGASDVLNTRGWVVVAQTSLQVVDAVPIVEQMAARGVFAETQTVVLHLGTNGTFTAEQLDALLAPLAGVPNVLLYTVHADRTWTEPNNALLRAANTASDNIVLIDWDARAAACPGDCFAGDGIHVTPDGKQFFADLARDWTGL